RGVSLGNLYLTEKQHGEQFSTDDEEAIRTLAAQAAIAIENSRLYEQLGRVSVHEERQRIGMDLHAGVIQSLYGVSRQLGAAAERRSTSPPMPSATYSVTPGRVARRCGSFAKTRRSCSRSATTASVSITSAPSMATAFATCASARSRSEVD